jgi:hypothetical protein
VPRRGVDRSSVRAYTRDISHLGQRVEVIDADVPGRTRPGDIKVTAVRVDSNVIESAIATDQLNLEDLIRTAVLSLGEAHKAEHHGECCNDRRLA